MKKNSASAYCSRVIPFLINIALVCALSLSVGLLLLQMFYRGRYGLDDQEHWICSWFIFNGSIPYRDFFQHHHPLLWYIQAPAFYFFDQIDVIFRAGRILAAVVFFAGCFLIGKIVQRLGGGPRSFLYALLVYLSYPVTAGLYIQSRPDTYMITSMLAGFYFWICFYQKREAKSLIFSYLFFFVSFAFLQKAVWFLFPFGIYQCYLLWKKQIRYRVFLKALIFPVLCTAGYLFYLWYTGSLERYFELNWILNLYWFRDYQDYSYDLLDYIYNLFTVCFLLLACLRGKGLIQSLSFVTLGFLFIFLWIPKNYSFYWLVVTPFSAVTLGLGFDKLLNKASLLRKFFLNGCLIFFCFLFTVHIFTDLCWSLETPFKKNMKNLETRIKPEDLLVDYGDYKGAFFSPYPKHYYWFSLMRGALWDIFLFHRYQLPDWDTIIYTQKPKYIIYHKIYNLMHADDNNTKHQIMGVDEDWLMKNYRYLEDCGVYERLSDGEGI